MKGRVLGQPVLLHYPLARAMLQPFVDYGGPVILEDGHPEVRKYSGGVCFDDNEILEWFCKVYQCNPSDVELAENFLYSAVKHAAGQPLMWNHPVIGEVVASRG